MEVPLRKWPCPLKDENPGPTATMHPFMQAVLKKQLHDNLTLVETFCFCKIITTHPDMAKHCLVLTQYILVKVSENNMKQKFGVVLER